VVPPTRLQSPQGCADSTQPPIRQTPPALMLAASFCGQRASQNCFSSNLPLRRQITQPAWAELPAVDPGQVEPAVPPASPATDAAAAPDRDDPAVPAAADAAAVSPVPRPRRPTCRRGGSTRACTRVQAAAVTYPAAHCRGYHHPRCPADGCQGGLRSPAGPGQDDRRTPVAPDRDGRSRASPGQDGHRSPVGLGQDGRPAVPDPSRDRSDSTDECDRRHHRLPYEWLPLAWGLLPRDLSVRLTGP
jgi:hypothetical protein